MSFRIWLEDMEKDFNFWKHLILNYLSLDHHLGLSQDLSPLNKNNLKAKLHGLGEFTQLPSEVQGEVLAKIDQGGTIGDLVRIMSARRMNSSPSEPTQTSENLHV